MTTPKVAPKVGDRVRVVLEGEVTSVDHYENRFTVGSGTYRNYIDTDEAHVNSVEILTPPVQVGDVATREVLDALPAGSVIVDAGGFALQLSTFCFDRRWIYATKHSGEYAPETVALFGAKVVFIPDPQ